MTSEVFNTDCLDYMRSLPDKHFDLALADPPYSDAGFSEKEHRNTRGRFNKYADNQQVTTPPTHNGTDSVGGSTVTRVGGTWAAKYAKKSSRGMWLRQKSFSRNSSASHATKSSLAETILNCRRADASSYGENYPSARSFQWQWLNTHGLRSTTTRKSLNVRRKGKQATRASIRRQSP